MSGRRIAAFDFDGTITRRDTVLPFLVRACGPVTVARALAKVAPIALQARLGRLDTDLHHRDAVKAALLGELLTRRSAAWYAEQGARFARSLPGRMRPEMEAQIRWHRDHGHELVLVSASLATYLDPFAAAFGFDHVIAVEMEVDAERHLTGQLQGANVRGPEKARRLQEWLHGDEVGFLWGYGNSSGDAELLALADVPVWLHRRPPR